MKYKILLLFCFLVGKALAQEGVDEKKWAFPEKYKMVSINTTPLLVQLIPFNRANPLQAGPYNVEFHRFSGDRAFHFSLGFNATSDLIDLDDPTLHVNMRIGSAKRRWSKDRWSLITGGDLYFSFGGFNLLTDDGSENENVVIGYGRRWSFAFAIQPQFSLSIETAMVIGWDPDFGEPVFVFIPPVSLNLNFVIPRGR